MDGGFGLPRAVRADGGVQPDELSQRFGLAHDTSIAIAGLMRYSHIPARSRWRARRGPPARRERFDARLPELFCGFASRNSPRRCPIRPPARHRRGPAPHPSCWCAVSSGSIRIFPEGRIRFRPHLPKAWNQFTVDRLMLAGHRLRLSATGGVVNAAEIPAEWALV
jgi:hypothetical protein